jgi:hypothetical protein
LEEWNSSDAFITDGLDSEGGSPMMRASREGEHESLIAGVVIVECIKCNIMIMI